MSHLKSILYAAVFTAAFFLRAETPISTYIEGRVDAVDLSLKDQFEPFIIDVNHSLSSNLLIATGVKGRMETVINNKYWRLGSETMGIWNSDSDFWLDSGSILLCTEHPQIGARSPIESCCSPPQALFAIQLSQFRSIYYSTDLKTFQIISSNFW